MTIARIAVGWAVLMFVVFGAWLLLAPDKLGTWLDVQPTSGKGRTEIRAFYGGVQLGIVAFGLLTLFVRPDWLAPACASLACMNLAIVACRLVGFALDGSASTGLWTILAIEATTGALALAGFLALQQASRSA